MSSISRFEELEAWRSARELTRRIYVLTGSRPLAADFALRNQMRRAAVSVMSNIAEEFERGGDKEFHQFLSVAKASAAEVRSQLYVALDAAFITQPQCDEAMNMAGQTSRLIAGMMRYLNKSSLQGSKRKP